MKAISDFEILGFEIFKILNFPINPEIPKSPNPETLTVMAPLPMLPILLSWAHRCRAL